MRTIKFLSRVAFICNICFLLTAALIWMEHPPEGALVSLVIVLGYFLAILFNVIVNICYLFLFLFRKPLPAFVPLWLLVINFLFLILQLILFLK